VLRGAEIGPLSRPIVKRSESEIYYVDHCSTEELKAKYSLDPNAHPDKIEDVDFVWKDLPLAAMLGDQAPLDYIIASHVIEHVPDLVGWLKEMSEALKAGGRLLLIVPDKRFTFDIYRRLSSMEEIANAHAEHRRRPGLRCLMDHFGGVVQVDTWSLWENFASADDLRYIHGPEYLELAQRHFFEGRYVDAHCWVFTPWSFLECIGHLVAKFGLDFELGRFLTTQDHDLEFYVQLIKRPNPQTDWSAVSHDAYETALWPTGVAPSMPADGLYRGHRSAGNPTAAPVTEPTVTSVPAEPPHATDLAHRLVRVSKRAVHRARRIAGRVKSRVSR
jgi:SAM-dependent methyltransferase